MQKDGGWLFISHSHQDIAVVRLIRNKLEDLGFEPLMFYLKSLNDDDEIVDLITREIDAREWFIYVDSSNARASRWVKTEREYVAKLSGKKIFTINADEDLDEQVNRIAGQLKVFISYAHADRKIARMFKDALVNRDLLVWTDEKIILGEDWVEQTREAAEDAAKNGFAIVIISAYSAQSIFFLHEIKTLLSLNCRIIPVVVDGEPLPGDLRSLVSRMRWIDRMQWTKLNSASAAEDVEQVVSRIVDSIQYDH